MFYGPFEDLFDSATSRMSNVTVLMTGHAAIFPIIMKKNVQYSDL